MYVKAEGLPGSKEHAFGMLVSSGIFSSIECHEETIILTVSQDLCRVYGIAGSAD